MTASTIESGISIDLIDTPCLIVDMDLVDDNLNKLFSKFRDLQVKVRPHLKTVKNPEFAKLLLAQGATGVCVAKVSEAEVMAEAGIEDILITTEIIGLPKIERLTKLITKHDRIRVVIDSSAGATAMQDAAWQAGIKLNVLIELNVGQNRAGVEPGQSALILANEISKQPNLNLIGIQGYEGHLQLLTNEEERQRLCVEAMEKLMNTVSLLRQNGHKIEVITTGGTGTSEYCAAGGANEIQPGSFVFMDGAYRKAIGNRYQNALTLVSTVISKPAENRCVIDAGFKSLSTDSGNAELKLHGDISYRPAGDEHGILESSGGKVNLNIGDRVELIPSHIDTTVNLHDYYYCHRGGKLENVWRISARGKVQ
ncbi:MAG: DSD1 family PLP-dependent enzyme [Candidatus Obscuribacterales bacterium]|nr:DSD1 family PLP-dependent enzyme [Candidatus Obscuribacterales bacterium]